MNRLIIIGNGFDLAHGLKTSYSDFIKYFMEDCLNKTGAKSYEGNLLSMHRNHSFPVQNISSVDLIKSAFNNGFQDYIVEDFISVKDFTTRKKPFLIKTNHEFFKTLLTNCSDKNWVDIEKIYFRALKSIFHGRRGEEEQLKDLHVAFEYIKMELSKYLTIVETRNQYVNSSYNDIFRLPISESDFSYNPQPPDLSLKNILILNFNYTDTCELYARNIPVNYIHGRLNDDKNPLIFGFGDEMDKEFKDIEDANNNEYFKNVKSFGYFQNSNYHDLLKFIQSENYQIFTLGHSCGLSDRTMLNMVFEHSNCKSIKIFYYIDKRRKNNHKDLTMEISRHFNSKTLMRERIVPVNLCRDMPQLDFTSKIV